jgi:radical SAM protein with 4Fe4S-binding SPASM domain
MPPLGHDEREDLMGRPRPVRALPIFAEGAGTKEGRKVLPLADARPEDDRWKPIVAVWEITLRCDLACRHCGSRAGHARPGELSTQECLDMVRHLKEIGTREVALIGGEAYLREDWLEILAAIRDHGMLATMTTGGRGFDAERAAAAKAAGLFSASVSIDGSEATHDRLRGVAGSYRSAVAALGHLRAAGVHVAVNTQINRLSLPDLGGVLDTVIAAGGKSWQIQLTVAMGRAADEPDILLQPYDLLELFPILADLKKRAAAARVNLLAGNNVGYFGPYEGLLRGSTARGHSGGCGAGRNSIGIEADGTIKGCPSLATRSWSGGNVRDTPLAEIWKRATPLRYTRDRTAKDLWGYCATCYYADTCRAGCTWTADVLFGRPGNNPYCHHRAIEMNRAGKRERVVRIEAPPNEPFDHGLFELIVEDVPAQAEPARASLASERAPID